MARAANGSLQRVTVDAARHCGERASPFARHGARGIQGSLEDFYALSGLGQVSDETRCDPFGLAFRPAEVLVAIPFAWVGGAIEYWWPATRGLGSCGG